MKNSLYAENQLRPRIISETGVGTKERVVVKDALGIRTTIGDEKVPHKEQLDDRRGSGTCKDTRDLSKRQGS
jgi:hypothetical protein